MRSYLLALCLLAPVFLGGCFEPAHYCPAPIEECEYGYLSSTATTNMTGMWNRTEVERAVEAYGFKISGIFPYGEVDEKNPGYLEDGSTQFPMFWGIWGDTSDQRIDIKIYVESWVAEDNQYNISLNLEYVVDQDTVHYLPMPLAESDRDHHQTMVKPLHREFIEYLENELGWEILQATEWSSSFDEKPPSVRLMEEEQGLWD